MENVHVFSTASICIFMVYNYSANWHSIKNTGNDLTMKQMLDISETLVSEQDEIYGVKTINSENSSWKYLSLNGDEEVISLQRTKVYVFSDSVLCLGEIHENVAQTQHGKKDWRNSKVHRNAQLWIELLVSQLDSSGLQLSHKIQELVLRLGETPENFFSGRMIFMSMFNDMPWRSKDNKKVRIKCSTDFSILKKIRSKTMVI